MSLYERDFYGWSQEQAALLRAGRLTELDTPNLLEEIEEMGRNAENELLSRLEVLFIHLLKWRFQPARRGRSWQLSIAGQRRKIARRLERSPSLKHKLPGILVDWGPSEKPGWTPAFSRPKAPGPSGRSWTLHSCQKKATESAHHRCQALLRQRHGLVDICVRVGR